MDERLKWFETRVNHALKLSNEVLKQLTNNDENRLVLYEFINNEDVKRIYIFRKTSGILVVALQAPSEIKGKAIFFIKHTAGKLTKENINSQVSFFETTEGILDHIHLMLREVYAPLLCGGTEGAPAKRAMSADVTDTGSGGAGVNVDKLMDLLHRLMAAVEVGQGLCEGRVVLALPSVEVLAEAATMPGRRASVLHVLETTVIAWIKQIKAVLRYDPIKELFHRFGAEPTPENEIQIWEDHLVKLESIEEQLIGPVAQDILTNLERSNSQYFHSFSNVIQEITNEKEDTKELLKFLIPLKSWFESLHTADSADEIVRLLPALLHMVFLLWQNSRYYHKNTNLQHFLRVFSNEIVHRALHIVGEDVMRDPLESHSKMKAALQICAGFRGTYLDTREKADELNKRNVDENAEKMKHMPKGALWTTKVYGPHAYKPLYGRDIDLNNPDLMVHELLLDSPWPPRNAACFNLLNAFMERCNDCLELVQTTQHFRLLADTAEIGGAGSKSLDALVREIHVRYNEAMKDFFAHVDNILDLTNVQNFERAFFKFRTIVKDLERALGSILRQSLHQCPTVLSQLRLLEVFEGINGRELVHAILKDKDDLIVKNFTEELKTVQGMFEANRDKPPPVPNVPPFVCTFYWLHGLKERIRVPIDKMKAIYPHLLTGDSGWQLRDLYKDTHEAITKFEQEKIKEWQNSMTEDLTECLKQPLLVRGETSELSANPPQVNVNLDCRLILLLKEIHYLAREPFLVELPPTARKLLRTTDLSQLRVTSTRLESIAAKYNYAMRTMTGFEKLLLERQLSKIDQILDEGLHTYTWRLDESADFIERATVLIVHDLAYTLDIVQSNSREINELTISWSQGVLDVCSLKKEGCTYTVEELELMQKELVEGIENIIVPAGHKIHQLLDGSLNVIQISKASPAWEEYVEFFDAVVLDGLKKSVSLSLRCMLNHIVMCNMQEEAEYTPILRIRLELLDTDVVFSPPLDEASSRPSVQEYVRQWVSAYLNRALLVTMLGAQGSYRDFLAIDEETVELVEQISEMVQTNGDECKRTLDIFKDYSFLWLQDVDQSFADFLEGKISPNPFRTPSRSQYKHPNMFISRATSRASSGLSRLTAEEEEIAERTFLTPKTKLPGSADVPSLDEFNAEINIYKTSRDELQGLSSFKDVGWLRVDLEPIKEILITLASKWMWTFTKYLADQVTTMLESLDEFLKRIEPDIENISGEERDTASFMRMMRLFNEVSSRQVEMEGKFSAMNRTVDLLAKYNQELPERTQRLLQTAPAAWNNLKTKVSLAKQRLGPRIQEEAEMITADLGEFYERVLSYQSELEKSAVYTWDCSIDTARLLIDNFSKRLTFLESEAQDLVELQDLLETQIVNFTILPRCRSDVTNLKTVWEHVRTIQAEQSEWKKHRWQRMNTMFLEEATNRQMVEVEGLPDSVKNWEVYSGLLETIMSIHSCLPLIDDLANPAMRTRHWKQLVRVTGGAVQIDNETLRRMTLGELLNLGLQGHTDEVRSIVQRAVKDLQIEQSLKTYEEVWLSKVFDLKRHARKSILGKMTEGGTEEAVLGNDRPSATTSRLQNPSRVSSQSVSSQRGRHASVYSLPMSLAGVANEDEETWLESDVMLLDKTGAMLTELESHQLSLSEMCTGGGAGSFLDDVVKWQRTLQQIEAVVRLWLKVQEKWVLMEEIFQSHEILTTLSSDVHKFRLANHDFRMVMKATEKNPNVLQCCSRKNITSILEKMNASLERCRKSLLNFFDRRRARFPWFYFLSPEDILRILGNGYDVKQLNLHIVSLWENVHTFLHSQCAHDSSITQIYGIKSKLEEPLYFKKNVICEGPLENWLSDVLTQIQDALRSQMMVALGKEEKWRRDTSPIPSSREPTAASATRPKGTKLKKPESGSKSAFASKTIPATDDIEERRSKEEAALRSHFVSEIMSANVKETPGLPSNEQSDWFLNHVTEALYLVLNIRFTETVDEAFSSGSPAAGLEKAKEDMETQKKELVTILRNLEVLEERLDTRTNTGGDDDGDTGRPVSETLSKGGLEISDQIIDQREGSADSAVTPLATEENVVEKPLSGSQEQGDEKPSSGGQEEGDQKPLSRGQEKDDEKSSSRGPDKDDENPSSRGQQKQEDEAKEVQERQPGTPFLQKPNFSKQEEKKNNEEPVDYNALQRQLLPSQLVKVRQLLALSSEHTEILTDLLRATQSQGAPSATTIWANQLKFYVEEEELVQVNIKSQKMEWKYDFHYIGSCNRSPLTRVSHWAVVNLLSAVHKNKGGICCADKDKHPSDLVLEVARLLGKPYATYHCSPNTTQETLGNIVRGVATTGSWVCLNNVNRLSPDLMSVLGQLAEALTNAYRSLENEGTGAAETVTLLGEEVALRLDQGGALFTTMDRLKPRLRGSTEVAFLERPYVFSTLASLPRHLLERFRVISVPKAHLEMLANTRLTSLGFTSASKLIPPMIDFISITNELIGCILDGKTAIPQLSVSPTHLLRMLTKAGYLLSEGKNKSKAGQDQILSIEKETELERSSLIRALHDFFMPRLSPDQQRLFSLLLRDCYPELKIEEEDEDKKVKPTYTTSPMESAVFTTTIAPSRVITSKLDPEALIQEAMEKSNLVASERFETRVVQLLGLYSAYPTVVVAGPAGCGKSTVIGCCASAHELTGSNLHVQKIYPAAVDVMDFLGQYSAEAKCWQNGLFQVVLHNFCDQNPNSELNVADKHNLLILDGPCSTEQREVLAPVLHRSSSTAVMGNGERLSLPEDFHVIWELESMADIHPGLVGFVGILAMTSDDFRWEMHTEQWIKTRGENAPSEGQMLESCFGDYLPTLVTYFQEATRPPITGPEKIGVAKLSCLIPQNVDSCLTTTTTLLEGLLNNAQTQEFSAADYELLVTYACLWGFGSNLDRQGRTSLSEWWRGQFKPLIDYPADGSLFDYYVDLDRVEYLPWTEMLPSYTGRQNCGVSGDAMVLTSGVQASVYNLGLLCEAMHPVLLVGPAGAGKTAVVQDRVRTSCSGEVAEVLNVTVHANHFTTANTIGERLDEKLEWKHGRTYIPKGNKRLMCFIDDLNLSHTDLDGKQTAVEMLRQLIDNDGHYYSSEGHAWRNLKQVQYVVTANPNLPFAPLTNQRLLRHFAVMAVNYPENTDLETIYSTLARAHFLPATEHSAPAGQLHAEERRLQHEKDRAQGRLLDQLVRVTVNLQTRLSGMFLPIAQRCHYVFSMRTLSVIFRNLCQSLNSKSSPTHLLSLWRNEAVWTYRQRMIDRVDRERFDKAYVTAVKKEFAEHYRLSDELLEVLLHPEPPLCTNITLQESGLVSTQHSKVDTDPEATWGDGYAVCSDTARLRELLLEAIGEYNKVNPRITMALYDHVLRQVSRLARTMSLPHNLGHQCLLAEANPGQAYLMVRLAAHLNGVKVIMTSPTSEDSSKEEKLDQFKRDLVSAYGLAGAKGEKILFVLRDFEMVDRDFLVYLTEFVVHGTISHLFSFEEQTQIINSIRSEVTQAGLSYTRDVAWAFFEGTVKDNLRVSLIFSRTGEDFQSWCRDYPALFSNIDFIWFGHCGKTLLVDSALFHLSQVATWMTPVEQENIAHLLASMHLALRQQDGGEQGSGQFQHVNNTTYQKFVQRFCTMLVDRHNEVQSDHETATCALNHIQQEGRLARRLKKQLEREKMVLEERRKGATRILTQIGQDTAITESQMRIVKQQIDKSRRLKHLLPQYQVSHERAVYKAMATTNETKKIIQKMNIDSLSELRSISKPPSELEDLMVAIIMILKSPSADLTWQKGAKRQMANLERFVEELVSFDEAELSEDTLNQVEAYVKKPGMDPDTLEQKTGVNAAGALCQWLRGVVRYHRIMHSRVRPLHTKVEETGKEVEAAEGRMKSLEVKRKALESRLSDLAKSFEEATIDKNNQELKSEKMCKMLTTASKLRRIMAGEFRKFQQTYSSLQERETCIPGSVAIAAGLTVYLGPYHHTFRCMMLTYYWPKCLRERGIPLVFDTIDVVKGRTVEFSLFPYHWTHVTLPSQETLSESEDDSFLPGSPEQSGETNGREGKIGQREEGGTPVRSPQVASNENIAENEDGATPEGTDQPPVENSQREGSSKAATPPKQASPTPEVGQSPPRSAERARESPAGSIGLGSARNTESLYESESESEFEIPILNDGQYLKYVVAVVARIVGVKRMSQWSREDFSLHQLLNAAIVVASTFRPPLLIDPHSVGVAHLKWIMDQEKTPRLPVEVDMTLRWTDPQVLTMMEDAIIRGQNLIIKNCSQLDNSLEPMIHHTNMALDKEETRMIRFGTRRILCHPLFKVFLATQHDCIDYTSDITSLTTLVNYGVSADSLLDELTNRAFAKLKPELNKERQLAIEEEQRWRSALTFLSQQMQVQLTESMDSKQMWSEASMTAISQTVQRLENAYNRLCTAEETLQRVVDLRREMTPLARHAAGVYSTLKSLCNLDTNYVFPLPYFLAMFDEAIGVDPFQDDGENQAVRGPTAARSSLRADSESKKTLEEDKEHPHSELPTVIKGEQCDGDFVQTLLSAREEEERVQVMQEITGRRPTQRETDTPTLDCFLTDRGTLRPRPIDPQELLVSETQSGEGRKEQERRREGGLSKQTTSISLREQEGVTLPTAGVEYSGLPAEEMEAFKRAVTELVYKKLRVSLFEEDILLFAFMLFMNTQLEKDEEPSEEEINFFLRGVSSIETPLTLKYFNCDLDPPSWMPEHVWKEVMALSIYSGPLDSVCVEIAKNEAVWRQWYKSDKPETLPPPVNSEEEGGLTSLSEFHQLLVVKVIRPDRLQQAIKQQMSHRFPFISCPEPLRLEELEKYIGNYFGGILVLHPPSPRFDHLHHHSFFPDLDPVVSLKAVAQESGIAVEHIVCNSTCQLQLSAALESAYQSGGWVVVQDIHLANPAVLNILSAYLDPGLTHETGTKRPIIWLTYHTDQNRLREDKIPTKMRLQLAVVSSEVVTSQLLEPMEEREEREPEDGETAYIRHAFHAAFSLLPSPQETLSTVTPKQQELYSALCVVNAIVLLRQSLGTRGMALWKVLTSQFALDCLDTLVKYEDPAELVEAIWKEVYSKLFIHDVDVLFVRELLNKLLGSTARGETDVRLGDAIITLPSANIDAAGLSQWLAGRDWGNDTHLAVITGLESQTIQDFHCQRADALVQGLADMYETQSVDSMTSKLTDPLAAASEISMLKLRTVLDFCMDQLPPLVEPEGLDANAFSFPYHNPSVLSVATSASGTVVQDKSGASRIVPETLSHALQEECSLFNRELCAVRQALHQLHSFVLSGPQSLPPYWLPVALRLQRELVPTDWIYPDARPTAHNLTSWIKYQCERYTQLRHWVKLGVTSGEKKVQSLPRSIWLGGFQRPQAFLTALRHEKAMAEGCSIQEIAFLIEFTTSQHANLIDSMDEASVIISGAYLSGGVQNEDNKLDLAQHTTLIEMPTFLLKVVSRQEITAIGTTYPCPVFKNRSRQTMIAHFHTPCIENSGDLNLRGTSIILDPGCLESSPLRTRIPIVAQPTVTPRGPLSLISSRSNEGTEATARPLPTVQEEDEAGTATPGPAGGPEDTPSSGQQSQLSSREYQPQAEPLPDDLRLERQPSLGGIDSEPSDRSSQQPQSNQTDSSRTPKGSDRSKGSGAGSTRRSQQSLDKQRGKAGSKGSLSGGEESTGPQSKKGESDVSAASTNRSGKGGSGESGRGSQKSLSQRSSTDTTRQIATDSEWEGGSTKRSKTSSKADEKEPATGRSEASTTDSVAESDYAASGEDASSETSTPRAGEETPKRQEDKPGFAPEHSTIYEERSETRDTHREEETVTERTEPEQSAQTTEREKDSPWPQESQTEPQEPQTGPQESQTGPQVTDSEESEKKSDRKTDSDTGAPQDNV